MPRYKIRCDDDEHWQRITADDAEAKHGRVLAWEGNAIIYARDVETATIKMLKDKKGKA